MTNDISHRKAFGSLRKSAEWVVACAIMRTTKMNAVSIGKSTGIGYGYVMEILKLFEANGFLTSVVSGRERVYSFTPLGKRVFNDIFSLEKLFLEMAA